jgi:hypothetical protein
MAHCHRQRSIGFLSVIKAVIVFQTLLKVEMKFNDQFESTGLKSITTAANDCTVIQTSRGWMGTALSKWNTTKFFANIRLGTGTVPWSQMEGLEANF